MCDETTEAENVAHLGRLRIGRRELCMGAGAAVATFSAGCGPSTASIHTPQPAAADPAPAASAPATARSTASRRVTIDTADGTAEAFLVAPEGGRHPGVILWPDIAGLRDAYEQMATRLAGDGYAVLAVNQYYRSAKLPIFESFEQWRTDEGRARIGPMREALTPEAIARDGAAFVAWLDQQPEVDPGRKLGSVGYCMGGPFAVRTAAAAPARAGAIASFHGSSLVTDEPTSPHLSFAKLTAALLLCIAHNDDEREPEAKTTLRQAAEAAGLEAEIEVYPAQHGWCTIDSPVYDVEHAERARARMLAVFGQHL
jgi:carboxymethylenebutenolidase